MDICVNNKKFMDKGKANGLECGKIEIMYNDQDTDKINPSTYKYGFVVR